MQVTLDSVSKVRCLTSDCEYCYEGYCCQEKMNNIIPFSSKDSEMLFSRECKYSKLDYEKYSNVQILDLIDSPNGISRTIIQYKLKDKDKKFISFAVSDHEKDEINKIIQELEKERPNMETYPIWSDLSKELLNFIVENEFDMNFIENEDITVKDKNKLLLEALKHPALDGVIEDGVFEECAIIIYAGAMCQINWYGSVYGACKLSDII